MKRLTLRTENQWLHFRDFMPVDLLRVMVVNDCFHAGIHLIVAGFGVGLTYWKHEARKWEAEEPTTYAWEPIETDGWAGLPQGELNRGYLDEPQGKEHAP